MVSSSQEHHIWGSGMGGGQAPLVHSLEARLYSEAGLLSAPKVFLQGGDVAYIILAGQEMLLTCFLPFSLYSP